MNYKIYKYESLDSTNTKAKELALRGAGEAVRSRPGAGVGWVGAGHLLRARTFSLV